LPSESPSVAQRTEGNCGLKTSDIPADVSAEVRTLLEQTLSADQEARARAAERLGKLESAAVKGGPFLIQLAFGERSQYEDGEAAKAALRRLGGRTVESCVAALKHMSGDQQEQLCLLLGTYDEPYPAEALAPLLAEPNVTTRLSATRGLVACFVRTQSLRVIPAIVRASKDSDPAVRKEARVALERLRDSKVISEVESCFADQLSEKRKHERALSVEERCGLGSTAGLLELLQDSNAHEGLRSTAAYALGQSGDPRVTPLVQVLTNRHEPAALRARAAWALKDTCAFPVCEALETILADLRCKVAAVAIGVFQPKDLAPLLMRIAKSQRESPRLRYHAAVHLVRATEGTIDDLDIVYAIADSTIRDEDFGVVDSDGTFVQCDALERLANHGSTFAVRRAAGKGPRRPAAEFLVPPPVPSMLYYTVTLGLWGFLYRSSLRRKQLTVQSLLVLVTILAAGFPLITMIGGIW
jgi:HEAT repeat protein